MFLSAQLTLSLLVCFPVIVFLISCGVGIIVSFTANKYHIKPNKKVSPLPPNQNGVTF